MGSRKQTSNGAARQNAEAEDPGSAELEDLHRVRKILFGAHAQDTADRFARLDKELRKQAAALRDEIREKFERLENRLQDEVEDLVTRVETEAATRAALDDRVQGGEASLRADKVDHVALATLLREMAERLNPAPDTGDR